jgi:hypothetical protein
MLIPVWLASWVLALSPADVEAARAAEEKIASMDAKAASQVEALLGSTNVYERQAALHRLTQRPELLRVSALVKLTPILDEDTELLQGHLCVSLQEHDLRERIMAEGIYETLAACRSDMTSNATLVAKILERLGTGFPSAERCPVMMRALSEKPAHLSMLKPCLGDCPLTELLQAAATRPAALELLSEGIGVVVDPSPLVALLDSKEPALAHRAALALVVREGLLADAALNSKAEGLVKTSVETQGCSQLKRGLFRLVGREQNFRAALIKRTKSGDAACAEVLAAMPMHDASEQALVAFINKRGASSELLDALTRSEQRPRAQLRAAVLQTVGAASDIHAVSRVMVRLGPVSSAEFARLARGYRKGCENQPMSYHDEPNEQWCPEAEEVLIQLAAQGGHRFSPRYVY